jgi:hypothetical protein
MSDLSTAETIVAELVAVGAEVRDMHYPGATCWYCKNATGRDDEPLLHKEDCLYRRAVEYLQAKRAMEGE